MAIYHLSVKTISRSAGRSATAAAAYRAGELIVDERTGEVHDYTHKRGIESAQLILPTNAPDWAADRAELWNAAEQSETRKNSTVAREFEIALPSELDEGQRQQLAHGFAREIVRRHGCVADVAIHAPSKAGDQRNHHAHILCSTRRLDSDGFTEKTRELDELKSGEVVRWRERFAQLQNRALREAGIENSVDHRSLEDQGIARVPGVHLGPAATAYERRTGRPSLRRLELEREAGERLGRARSEGEYERQMAPQERGVIETDTDLAAARQAREVLLQQTTQGRAAFRQQFERDRQDKQVQADAEKTRQPIERQPTLERTAPERQREGPELPSLPRGRDRDDGLSR